MAKAIPFSEGQVSVSPPVGERTSFMIHYFREFADEHAAYEHARLLQDLLTAKGERPPRTL